MNPDDNKFSGKSIYKSGCGLPNVHFTSDLISTEDYKCRKTPTGWIVKGTKPLSLPLLPIPSFRSTLRAALLHSTPSLAHSYTEGNRDSLPMTLNHYAVKSWEHFKEKTKKWHFGLNQTLFDTQLQTSNNYKDETLVKFVEPVKELVKCMKSTK